MTIAPRVRPGAPVDRRRRRRDPLLPAREAVLARLAEQLPATEGTPACLLVIGCCAATTAGRRRRARWPRSRCCSRARCAPTTGWRAPAPPSSSSSCAGPAVGGRVAADRLVAAIAALGIPGLSAAAGIAPLAAHLSAEEALRRATVSLTAARRVGAGTVVQYREPY